MYYSPETWVILETRMPPLMVFRGSLSSALATPQLSGSFSCRPTRIHSPAIRVSCPEQLQAAQSRGKQVVYRKLRSGGLQSPTTSEHLIAYKKFLMRVQCVTCCGQIQMTVAAEE
ncbi:hypothetical protein U0070_011299 [Myodes glareolus]|uniref:Uncharacterized protein n=1 Tax=Myodes glareolus TaxID=447135 RepID=A0AAW0HI29_MYOGA